MIWAMLQSIGHYCYRAIRRLKLLDVTGVWWLPAHNPKDNIRQSPRRVVRTIAPAELEQLIRDGKIHHVADTLQDHHHLVGVEVDDRIVSFVWVATGHVPANQNFSRSRHLGSSLSLPEGVGFLFNAWTDEAHRGQGLLRHLITQLASGAVPTLQLDHFLTTIDWTNTASHRAFTKSGFTRLGHVWRLGRSRFQLTLVPKIELREIGGGLCPQTRALANRKTSQRSEQHAEPSLSPRSPCGQCVISRVLACEGADTLAKTEIARDVPGLRVSW